MSYSNREPLLIRINTGSLVYFLKFNFLKINTITCKTEWKLSYFKDRSQSYIYSGQLHLTSNFFVLDIFRILLIYVTSPNKCPQKFVHNPIMYRPQ